MKIILFTSVVLAAFTINAQSSLPADSEQDSAIRLFAPKAFAQIGHPFPEFSFQSNGKMINNAALKGKVVVINFWFEACAPCMAEMEALNELFEKFKDNKDFRFISNSKDSQEIANRVKNKYGLTFDVISTSNEECRRLVFDGGYPTSIVLDKSGTIKFLHMCGPIEKEKAREYIMTKVLHEIQSIL